MEANTYNGSKVLDNELVKALVSQFRHSPRTDMRNKRITNKDMIALCMFACGPLTARDLQLISLVWRGAKKTLDVYFIPHYGHTATDVTGRKRYSGMYCSAIRTRRWYRATENEKRVELPWLVQPMKRYTNDLTEQGISRCKALLECYPKG